MMNLPFSSKIRLVLVDDHNLVRGCISALLQTEVTFEVVGEASNGVEGLTMVRELKPNIVLLDLNLPGFPGLEVLQRLADEALCSTIILSAHSDEHHLTHALRYGAAGYVLKDCCASELVEAVRTVASGDIFVSPTLRNNALEVSLKRSGMLLGTAEGVTTREQQVLRLAAHGKTSTEIANKLSISRRSAEAHKANLMKKLALKTQTDLVLYAVRKGIISA
jgi:two-component system response regulator NreC